MPWLIKKVEKLERVLIPGHGFLSDDDVDFIHGLLEETHQNRGDTIVYDNDLRDVLDKIRELNQKPS